ncbi:TetR/AcrR family transcriptional regulator [Saccharomonospora viridis]|uniref:TetR/AcrR family transcriptional regulator n=1 Tax=Saccharomonospora viridis TaxID=1852 RepID=UPI000303016C|nr:TetR family transcriptional regulator C-terminal domain-containing protein [Saccharomonospora viridis]
MPRHVDRSERRTAVGHALMRIVARDGMEAVSVRSVAAEAGMSVGAVQRYFAGKDEMLRFALHVAVDAAAARLSEVRIGPGGLSFAEGLRQALLTFLPTPETLAEARILAAFEARAVVDADFAAVLAELDDEARRNVRRALDYASSTGELAPGQDLEALTHLVLLLMDGVLWYGLRSSASGREGLTAAVDAVVALVTGGPARTAAR